jgi:hypothetical protein
LRVHPSEVKIYLGGNKSKKVRFEVFTGVTMKNAVLWDVTPSGFVRIDVSEESSASIIRVTRIGELGKH